ncbi:MAG: fumarylacetoacetate hydrolase family protein [Lentisphaeria bacterium]|nr:fumarylacetoacetate hydrolase family protein [Lentisphaeria bacterium]NQZ69811.1 fumarylacetoacetate hydrolase family protein [Lentisphaeria bacterium]
MKLCQFFHDDKIKCGLISDTLVSVSDLMIFELLALSTAELQHYFESITETIPLNDVRLTAPLIYPGKIFALAGNYEAHIIESHDELQEQDKQTPRVFFKPPSNTVIGPGDAIKIPAIGNAIDWEGELAVVMGKRASAVKRDVAMDYVAGYTIMNDVSERQLKIWDRTDSRDKDLWFDWLNGKWCDTFAPMGPWIVTVDELTDPHDVNISTYVNGERKQNCSSSQMIFKIPEIIEYISAFATLEVGDVISTGTVAGVGATTGTFLKPGDQVKVEISKIGALENSVE